MIINIRPLTPNQMHIIVTIQFMIGFLLVNAESLLLVVIGTMLLFSSAFYFLMIIGKRDAEHKAAEHKADEKSV